jgi:hypothetical protein
VAGDYTERYDATANLQPSRRGGEIRDGVEEGGRIGKVGDHEICARLGQLPGVVPAGGHREGETAMGMRTVDVTGRVGLEPSWFEVTAFGDEAPTRRDLAGLAIAKYARRLGAPIAASFSGIASS